MNLNPLSANKNAPLSWGNVSLPIQKPSQSAQSSQPSQSSQSSSCTEDEKSQELRHPVGSWAMPIPPLPPKHPAQEQGHRLPHIPPQPPMIDKSKVPSFMPHGSYRKSVCSRELEVQRHQASLQMKAFMKSSEPCHISTERKQEMYRRFQELFRFLSVAV